ncbi:MAG: hypothetical protein RBS57_01540 [Desulforhabdus sp.]|nr:hypothetical protein [Desulforhabdus sp.]
MLQTGKIKSLSAILFCLVVVGFFSAGGIAADYSNFDKEVYYRALQDSQNPEQDDISSRLLAIVPFWDELNWQILNGGEIQWEGVPGSSRLLAVAFMKRQDYESYYKEHMENRRNEDYTLKKSLFVTVVPELQNYFIPTSEPTLRCPPTPKRVVKLLGLNPANDYDVLVEMWVDPNDLFRPSPDPEINDHEAELAYRDAFDNWVFPREANPFIKYDDTALFMDSAWSQPVTFRDWFTNRAETVYQIGEFSDVSTWGYPWTRLGYTYDWGSMVKHVGLSEFVIRLDPDQGGEVLVKLERAIDAATPQWNSYFNCWQPR